MTPNTGTPQPTATRTTGTSTTIKVLAAVGGALALVGITAGTAMALDDDTPAASPTAEVQGDDIGSELLDDLAAELDVSPAELRDAMGAVLADRLDQRVADGRLTAAQADAALAAFEDGELAELLRAEAADRDLPIDVEAVLDRAVERGVIDQERADSIAERVAGRGGRAGRGVAGWLD